MHYQVIDFRVQMSSFLYYSYVLEDCVQSVYGVKK